MVDKKEFHGSEIEHDEAQTQKAAGENVESSVRKREVKLQKGLMATRYFTETKKVKI